MQVVDKVSKTWTNEEVEYLEESWGNVSLPAISKRLGRTESSVLNKQTRMGLGAFLENGEYVSWNQFQKAIGNESSSGYKLTSWVKNRGFPLKARKVNRKSFYVVFLDDWWKWAEKNQSFLDFSNFEEFALGKEPEWAKEKRKHDKEHSRKYISTPWTVAEDEKLKYLIDQCKYTYSDISKMLRRTEGAITRRCNDIGIKGRPLRLSPNNKWEGWQKDKLRELIEAGVSYEYMSKEIGKSAKAIRGMVYRTYGTEVLDKARKLIKE